LIDFAHNFDDDDDDDDTLPPLIKHRPSA